MFLKKINDIKTTPLTKSVRNYQNVDKLFTFSQVASSASLTPFNMSFKKPKKAKENLSITSADLHLPKTLLVVKNMNG
jgi:hypothetical protein